MSAFDIDAAATVHPDNGHPGYVDYIEPIADFLVQDDPALGCSQSCCPAA